MMADIKDCICSLIVGASADAEPVTAAAESFASVEDARAAVPAILRRAECQALIPFEEAEVIDAEPEPEPDAVPVPAPRRKKICVPKDGDECRALAAFMLSMFFPGDGRSVENTVHRNSLKHRKKIDGALRRLVRYGLIVTFSDKKRTYYAPTPEAREALCAEGGAR